MTGCRVVVTAIAEQDVRGIAEYISSNNGIAARRFGAEFALAVERIGEFPGTGYALLESYRTILGVRISPRFKHYTVIYRRDDASTIRILRVVHSARDIRAILAGLK
jgi:plasmid stabilization system protein ParE